MRDRSTSMPLLFGFLAAFCWGTHSVIVRYLTGDMQGITIATLRLYIAAAALFVLMKLLRFPVSGRLTDRNLQIAVGSTVINYICFHIGLEHTSASNAMMLENTAPFFVLLILFLLAGETVRRRDIFATLVALAGVFLTVIHDIDIGGEGLQGDMLEIAAGLSWAGFIIGSSRALRASASTAERVNFLLNVFICSAILLTPLMLIYPGSATSNDIMLLVLLGLFPTALAYYLWYEAAARVSAVSAALLFILSVIFTFINAVLFLGENLSANILIGAVLIVAGVIITSTGSAKSS
ncbi:DMT family transporter [Hoeflea poritis]|uniref:DMT family transporter n=1 Tax=Hoeflea poritis TaxID=2993659 RepID=A0ABT4VH87_9HYPH|nr:DMT family transporter [Hoeflea poritis]MDA4844068.1 DMT family transporter [Hoeflea poritis]